MHVQCLISSDILFLHVNLKEIWTCQIQQRGFQPESTHWSIPLNQRRPTNLGLLEIFQPWRLKVGEMFPQIEGSLGPLEAVAMDSPRPKMCLAQCNCVSWVLACASVLPQLSVIFDNITWYHTAKNKEPKRNIVPSFNLSYLINPDHHCAEERKCALALSSSPVPSLSQS